MKYKERPLVAIRCLVYNHEKYLHDCLDGFVMQQTNFSYVVIVHDDASTDRSAAIIREYEEKYPNIFKPIYEAENQYSKHDGSLDRILEQAIDAVGADYVALCEGDDYWTDPLKLQKQVDILENNKSLMLCCTNCSVVDNHNIEIQAVRGGIVKNDVQGRYNLRDFFRDNHQYPTLSIVYRRTHSQEIAEKYVYTRNAFLGDWTFWICLMIYGDAFFLNEVTCAYRLNPASITHTCSRVGRAKSIWTICRAIADILPIEYDDISSDLRRADWAWIDLMFAYKYERRYINMLCVALIVLIKCPKLLWIAYREAIDKKLSRE